MTKTLTDLHYDDCPSCEARGQQGNKAHVFGHDPQGVIVYECKICGDKFGESKLKKAHGARLMRD